MGLLDKVNPFKGRHSGFKGSSGHLEPPSNPPGDKRSIRSNASTAEDPTANYDIREELGRGGFAVVHRAHKKGEKLNIDIAMKVAPLDLVYRDPRIDTRQKLKARMEWAQALLNRPDNMGGEYIKYILFAIDYKITRTDLITFMELCPGGDLFERIVNSPGGHLPEEEAQQVSRNICMALIQTLHVVIDECIVTIRTAENFFYADKRQRPQDIRVADFGCAVIDTTRDAWHTGIAGSPGYTSPEMCEGRPYNMLVDEWSFVRRGTVQGKWALNNAQGVCVYEMLTGRAPLVSDNPQDLAIETIEREIAYPPRYWRRVSPEGKGFVQKLLCKDPGRRMSVEEAICHPWLKNVGSTPKAQQPATAEETAQDAAMPDRSMSIAMRKTKIATFVQTQQTKQQGAVKDVALHTATTGAYDGRGMTTNDILAGHQLSSEEAAALRNVGSDSGSDGAMSSRQNTPRSTKQSF